MRWVVTHFAVAATLIVSSALDAQPCIQGFWEPPFDHPDPRLNPADPWFACPPPMANQSATYEAVHLALIPIGENRGRVLAVDWSWNIFVKNYPPGLYQQRYAVVDPGDVSTGTPPQFWNAIHDSSSEPAGDMMCGGHSWTDDGYLFWASGNEYTAAGINGHRKCWIYKPEPSGSSGAGAFSYVGQLQSGRWYPTVTNVGFGFMMVSGGRPNPGTQINSYELYSLASNQSFGPISGPALPSSPFSDYPRMHLIPEGFGNGVGLVFTSGEEPNSALTSLLFPGFWFGASWNTGVARHHGSSVHYSNVQGQQNAVWRMGGAPGGPPVAPVGTVESTDAGSLVGSWVNRPSLQNPRMHHNVVILPDSTLFVVGGTSNNTPEIMPPIPPVPVLQAELLAPGATAWVTTPAMASPRTYHSTALLLPNGKVLVSGGDPGDLFTPIPGSGRSFDYQIYVPPYLACGGEQPTITASPATMPLHDPSSPMRHTATFSPLVTPGLTVTKAVLVAPGAVTHSFDHNQRVVELPIVGTTSTSISFFAPAPMGTNPAFAAHAPKGWYMLFLLTSAGVPSVAAWVQIV